ncbi:unnamed protein product [Pieris brassicae]|uniref:PiggyBac transposable element-derived protein domain-containing protein n=1 Tax=Pieris brassicae TaxID=7116 RepID=A0A9P0TGN8_PIEBR|nr:unnamed protein product [Pieris brassicae]
MPLKKFEKIRSTLHFADNTLCLPKDHPDYDRLFKIRPLEEMLNCQFGKVPLDQRLSIDEQMCATKMSHYIKQYMPNKPHKWGFKLYLICSLQGYAHRFEVYSGGGSKNNILPGEPDLGESGNTVVRLTRMVPRNVNHIIYFDNFYTSVPLVTYLAKEGIFSLGTVRVNRLRNCKLPDKNTIMKKNVPRGFYEENVATVDDIDVSAVVWKDNKPVNLLSTYVGAEPATTVTRFDKSKKERVAIPCPKVIKEYNAHMGGVDLLDSFIGRYHITIKSRKWTMRLFYHFLDLAVINSWVMFKKVNNIKGNDQLLNLGTFRLELAETLCKLGLPANGAKRGRPSGSTIQRELVMKKFRGPAQAIPLKDVRLDQTCHWAVWLDKQQRVKVREYYFRSTFKKYFNLGFGTPRTDTCSKCNELLGRINRSTDVVEKTNLMTEKKVHMLKARAFYRLLKEKRDDLIVFPFDCQKNQVLPKISDYSRQLYIYNFGVVKSVPENTLNRNNVKLYIWTEDGNRKGANEVA